MALARFGIVTAFVIVVGSLAFWADHIGLIAGSGPELDIKYDSIFGKQVTSKLDYCGWSLNYRVFLDKKEFRAGIIAKTRLN
jgi:hypothetical protein